jgi:hypothetical protein
MNIHQQRKEKRRERERDEKWKCRWIDNNEQFFRARERDSDTDSSIGNGERPLFLLLLVADK